MPVSTPGFPCQVVSDGETGARRSLTLFHNEVMKYGI